jgi:hypothetical protein
MHTHTLKSISDNLVVEIPYAEHSNDALTILDSFTFTPATANAALAVFLPAEVDGEAQVAALCGVFVMLAKQVRVCVCVYTVYRCVEMLFAHVYTLNHTHTLTHTHSHAGPRQPGVLSTLCIRGQCAGARR